MIKQLTFLLSLTFIFLFSGSVYGDELEVKKEFYDSGKLKSETHYKNGEKWGRETEWYKSGKKWSETLRTPKGFYFEGIKEKSDKLETTWWENGRLRTEFYFRGQSQTLWTWWFETGVKQSEERWNDGGKVSTTNYYESGKKFIEYQYKREALFSQTNFYPTGLKKHTKHYKDGRENGIRTEWSEDGKKTFEGNFVDGNEE